MNQRQLAAQITSHLDRWGTMLREHGAKPVVLIGQIPSGEAVLCCMEGVSPSDMARFLREVVAILEEERPT